MKYALLSTLIFAILTTIFSVKLIQARQHPIEFIRSLSYEKQDAVFVDLSGDRF